LKIEAPKACIDVVLGAIALTSKKRSMDEYIKDMVERGQTDDRVKEVKTALSPYWEKIKSGKVKLITAKLKPLSIDELTKKLVDLKIIDLNKEDQEKLKKLVELKQLKGPDFPEEFLCPITKEPMVDPVMLDDGNSYDRYAIRKWIDSGNTKSPVDGKNISANLIPNNSVKKMINSYLDKHYN